MADVLWVSRRDSAFREYPPASAQLASVIAFYGDLSIWIRTPGSSGWHFPVSGRRSGETILEVAKRELWDHARIVAAKLDLLGAIRQDGAQPSTSYVYMCDARHLPWAFDLPEGVEEIGVFRGAPDPVASDWSLEVLAHAHRARLLGLR